MGFVYMCVGVLALAVGAGVLWGVIVVIELMSKAMGPDPFLIVIATPLILVIGYLLGRGIYEFRKVKSR